MESENDIIDDFGDGEGKNMNMNIIKLNDTQLYKQNQNIHHNSFENLGELELPELGDDAYFMEQYTNIYNHNNNSNFNK